MQDVRSKEGGREGRLCLLTHSAHVGEVVGSARGDDVDALNARLVYIRSACEGSGGRGKGLGKFSLLNYSEEGGCSGVGGV